MVTRSPRPRRAVGDAEFEAALADPDNRRVLREVGSRFSRSLDRDQRYACGLLALWRALQYHRPEFNSRFTSSLRCFMRWECLRELRRRPPRLYPLLDEPAVPCTAARDEALAHVLQRLEGLPPEARRVLRLRYLEGRSVARADGCHKSVASRKLASALAQLRSVCLSV